jgi:hypothetical protein
MAMKNVQTSFKSQLLVSAVSALAAALSFSAYAGDPVKSGSDYTKPGRQIEEAGTPVKAGDGSKKFGRQLDEDGSPVKAGGAKDRPGRALNQEQVRNGKAHKPIEE